MAAALSFAQPYLVEHQIQLREVVNRFKYRGTRIYADTETTGLNPRKNKLVMLQLMQEGYAPVIVDWRVQTIQKWGADYLNELSELVWVGHNFAGFDWAVLAANGIRLKKIFDTQIAEQVLHSSSLSGNVSLKDVVLKYANVTLDKTQREWFYKPQPLDERPEWGEPFPDEEIQYGALDVLYLPQVFHAQCEALKRQQLMPIMQLEMRALPAISQMRLNGIHIDVDAWRKVIEAKAAEAKELEGGLLDSELGQAVLRSRIREFDAGMETYKAWEQARDEALVGCKAEFERTWGGDPGTTGFLKWGEWKNRWMKQWREEHPNPGKPKPNLKEVNLGSSQQLIAGLRELGIPVPVNREGKETADAESLERLSGKYPALAPLLKFRKAEKFVSSFGESLLERIEDDGRIHPEYNQIGAETGRMSCQNPNWQQIPSKGDGKLLRACVVAPAGYKLLTADLPNIELRILANESGDENMLAMFASGEDLHSYTAKRMFGIPDTLTPDEVKEWIWKPEKKLKGRDVAKTVNFGVAYGQSYMGLAQKFNLPEDEAKRIIEMWNGLYPRARAWLTEQGDAAVEWGFSVDAAGRKRYYHLPEQPRSRNSEKYEEWRMAAGSVRRQGMNYPMQALCASIVKRAIANFDEHITLAGYDARLVAVVHDEMVVEVAEPEAWLVEIELGMAMLDACKKYLKVVDIPSIEVHIGDRWEH